MKPDLTRCARSVANTPEPPACDPSFTLNRQIAQARQDMGPVKWAALQREWL